MPEISLTRAPAHLRHGSNIGQPLTRRDGVLKVTGGARYAADHHPAGMALCGSRGEPHRARSRDLPRRAGRQGPSRRDRGHDPGQPAAARRGPGREDEPLHVPPRSAAGRPGALCQPVDRGGDRRDAGGGDGRSRTARAALRGAAGPGRPRCRRQLRAPRRRHRQSGPDAAGRCGGGARGRAASHRCDLRDARPVPQCDGAARDRGGVGR